MWGGASPGQNSLPLRFRQFLSNPISSEAVVPGRAWCSALATPRGCNRAVRGRLAKNIVLQAGATGIDPSGRPALPRATGSIRSFVVTSLGSTSIAEFELGAAGFVQLDVFDLTGKLVSGVVASHLESGRHSIPVDLSPTSGSGPMLVRLRTPDGEMVKTLTRDP